ncbi:hypothetical protein [Streptomyces sp. NPDC055105]|uniref:hypothetical protein n=1 Tax=Streptomyces sp. NPDC055105 TaxID=3365719 RepID=UPI0037D6E2A5
MTPLATAALTLPALYAAVRTFVGSYKRDVAENRQRLQRELQISGDGGISIREPNVEPQADASSDGPDGTESPTSTHNTYYNIRVDQNASPEELRAEREEQTFSLLLADYYAHGLRDHLNW